MNKKISYILLEQDKSHINNSDSDFSENEYKNKNYKIQKYEKFKPKPILKNQTNKTLKGAENKVKYLLSMFLKNIESEENNSDMKFKQNNTLKIKDKGSPISIKKKIKTIQTSNNKNLGRTRSYNSNRDKKINIYKNIQSNNNLNLLNNKFEESTPKSSFFSNLFHSKKVAFNINPINLTNSDSQKEGNYIYNKKNKKISSIKVSNTLKNKNKTNDTLERADSIKSEYLKKEKTHLTNESPKISLRKVHYNKRENSTESNLNNIRSLIKKTKSEANNNNAINFKNDNFLITKNNEKEHKKKKKITFKNFINNIIANTNNKIKKSKNNVIFNESNVNSVLSENSDCNINKKSIDLKQTIKNNKIEDSIKKEKNSLLSSNKRNSSTLIKKEFSTLSSKKQSIENIDLSLKNSIVKHSVKPKRTSEFKSSLDIKNLKRSESIRVEKNKFRRLNTHFRTLKHQIKQSIILRPIEEKKLSNKSNKPLINNISVQKKTKNKSNSNKLINKLFNYNIYKNKKSSYSNNNIVRIKSNNNLNLGFISNSETKKSNNSNKNNIQEQISEQTSSVKKLNTENETHENAPKQEKKEYSKNSSFEDFSTYSIKRKNNVYYEKYRILTHKGNIYDSLDDEEFEDEEDFNSLYLDPHSIFTITFDAILFIFNIISFFEVPLYLAINHNFCSNYFTLNYGINLFIECLNCFDLFFGFFRAYYNWEEQLIKKNKIIAIKYLTGWFLFDLISAIPVYSLIKIHEPSCNEKYLSIKNYNIILNNLNYLFICNRLLKILKIFWYNQAWKIFSNKLNDFWSMAINIFLVLAALNYTACLYIFVARNSYPNWILHTKLETHSFNDIYICAIYILIMALTTVGYGDITCYSLIERVFQLFLLVIGIMAYSWLVSSFSNYIQKLNERTADFEKKKSILDEIKVNHKNLPDSLYDRILRHLKFKNFHEKKLINIIFDCLPVGLKNNLISEMYKPIIKNFIFFKNFQNTDFIVRVILCFKPILAYKNDILVNDGDIIEEIMFVKRGILSVELPINMTNPQENIDKYLNTSLLKIEKGPNVEKIGNSTLIQANTKKYKKMINSIESDKNKPKKINSFMNVSTYNSSVNYTVSFNNNQTLSKKQTIQIETTYVKILGIRENEHFGDVLMFLEQRSPLRVRVRSKKCELFFLKKMDAVKISTSYQNIWKRINKKSVFNYEQIKKCIKKIVEIYCSVKKINSLNSESEDDICGREFGIKETGIGVHPKNFDLNNSALISKKKIFLKKNHSLKDVQIKNINVFFKNENISNDYFLININNIKNKERKNYMSERIQKKYYDLISTNTNKLSLTSFSSSSSLASSPFSSSLSSKKYTKKNKKRKSSKKNKKKIPKKLLDAFQGNYKYYKGINNKEIKDIKQATIISEEPDKESSLTALKYTNSLQRLATNKKYLNALSLKKSFYEEEVNPINEKDEEEDIYKRIDWNNNNRNNNYIYENNNEILSKSLCSNLSSYEREINNEIYPGEIIQTNQEENLLFKKIDINKEENNINEINSDFDYKNTKIKKLLKSYDKSKLEKYEQKNINDMNNSSNPSDKIDEKYKLSINGDVANNFYSNKNNCLNIKSNISSKNIESIINIKMNWDAKTLSINNNISLEFDSSYENCNLLTGEKLIKNKYLQKKLKTFLLEEITNISRFNSNNNLFKKINSFADETIKEKINRSNKNLFHNVIKPIKRLSSTNLNYSNKLNNFKNIKMKVKKKIKNSNSLMSKRSRTINSNSFGLEHSSSLRENNLKSKKNKNKFKTGIGLELFGNSKMNMGMINKLGNKKANTKGLQFKFNNNNIKSINNSNIFNNSSKEIPKKIVRKRRNSLIISNFPKNRKRRDSLLSQINFNIKKTNQNLNNPDEFYSNYFNFLLEGEREKNNQKNKNNKNLFSTTMIYNSGKRTNRNKSYILKNNKNNNINV